MQAGSVAKVEKGVDQAASAALGIACGYAAYSWFAPHVGQPILVAQTCVSTVFAYLLGVQLLRAVKPRVRRLPVPVFDVRAVEPFDASEILFIESQTAHASRDQSELLVLEDRLAEATPDSRVVRLFDVSAMPHCETDGGRLASTSALCQPPVGQDDASQALQEALAELRRSLR